MLQPLPATPNRRAAWSNSLSGCRAETAIRWIRSREPWWLALRWPAYGRPEQAPAETRSLPHRWARPRRGLAPPSWMPHWSHKPARAPSCRQAPKARGTPAPPRRRGRKPGLSYGDFRVVDLGGIVNSQAQLRRVFDMARLPNEAVHVGAG